MKMFTFVKNIDIGKMCMIKCLQYQIENYYTLIISLIQK